jgi:hypothetical protein
LNHACLHGMKLFWSWWMVFLICSWIWGIFISIQ